jgi:hypothetical protein
MRFLFFFIKRINDYCFSKPLFGESSSFTNIKTNKDDDQEEEEEEDEEEENDNDDENNKTKPSLFETAAEYEAKRAATHPAANIQGDTSTGEEHEVTKFQVYKKKIFFYSKNLFPKNF